MEIEKTLSPQESLLLITDTIAHTKENIQQNSFPFLLWGWLIAIASFAFFFLHNYTTTRFYFLPFPLLAVIGVVTTIIFYRKNVVTSTLTYLSNFMYKMWMVLGIAFFTVVFINVSQNHLPFTYTLIIAGIGTFTSGLVMKFQPLNIGGVLFLVAALASIYIDDDYKPLLHGIAVVAGYLIPGYLLKNSKV
jgi:hypothetical protein